MNESRITHPIRDEDAARYWAGDLEAPEAEAIEEHAFQCGECTTLLTSIGELTRAIAEVVRAGRFSTVVNEGMLNRLARDGVRMRTYVLQPGERVPCAVWADDELIVTRYRAPLSGVETATLAIRLASGDELGRLEVVVQPGQQEIIDVLSAERIRQLPETKVHVSLTTRGEGSDRVLAEYVLEHEGAFDRPGGHE